MNVDDVRELRLDGETHEVSQIWQPERRVARVCAPAHFIIGGGASKKLHKFADKLDVDASIRVAQFRNNAGIVGAAISASESGDPTSLRPRTH